jgi:hypothetical protein
MRGCGETGTSAQQGSRSVLKKSTKKLLTARATSLPPWQPPSGVAREIKVFWFFFSKKNCFLAEN